jgi:hypothetical protein
MKTDRAATVCVFLFLAALYLVFSGDRYDNIPVSDEYVMFKTTATLVEQGALRPKLDGPYAGQEAKYGLGQSLAALPLYLVARALNGLRPDRVPPEAIFFPVVYATNALICAAIGALFFAIARRLGYGRRTAIAGALVVGTATIVAVYSKSFFSEPLVALCLLGAAGAFTGEPPVPPDRAWLRAGAWLAVAILARLDNVIIVPVFLAGLWLGVEWARRREAWRGTTLFALPLLVMALVILWTNYLRSGRFQFSGYGGETFSTFFLSGLFGLLFSPSHGVFWYSPPLALAIVYIVRFHRRHSRLCFVVFAVIALKLFVFAKWWNWFGGWSWGSRFLLPVVPLAMLALLDPLSRWSQLRRVEKALIAAAVAAGLAVQAAGLLVAPNAYHGTIQFLAGAGSGRVQLLADREQLLTFSPPQSPLIGNWPIIAHARLDWFGLRFTDYFPSSLLIAILMFLGVVLVLSAWLLVRAWLAENKHPQISQIPQIFETPHTARELPHAVPMVAWWLFLINVAVFAVLAAAMRGNGLWRTERIEYADGRKTESLSRVSCVYLDDRIAEPAAAVANRSTEWLGYLEIPLSGTSSFYTVALGAFDLQIAERPVLANNLTGGRRSQRAEIDLQRGLYPLRLSYTPTKEAAGETTHWPRQMQLYWTLPGAGEYEQVIGRAWFYPTMPGPIRRLLAFVYRLKVGFVVVSLFVLWWLWVHSILKARIEGIGTTDEHRWIRSFGHHP